MYARRGKKEVGSAVVSSLACCGVLGSEEEEGADLFFLLSEGCVRKCSTRALSLGVDTRADVQRHARLRIADVCSKTPRRVRSPCVSLHT